MDLAMVNIPMHGCIPVYNDIIFKWVQAEFALPSTYVGPWCLVSPRVSACIFHCRHYKNLNTFFLVPVVGKLLDGWKYFSSVIALTRHPLSLLLPSLPPCSFRSCLQHAPWQCESMWGGIWETEGQSHDVSYTDSDRQEPALVCVQRRHHYRVPGQRSWLVNTSCICLWSQKKNLSWLSAGFNLIVPTEKQTLALYLRLHFGLDIMVKS